MISMKGIKTAARRFLEATTKSRMDSAIVSINTTLLSYSRERIEEMGYSYEALQMGPGAWPWRKTTQDSAITVENVYGAVAGLEKMSNNSGENSTSNESGQNNQNVA